MTSFSTPSSVASPFVIAALVLCLVSTIAVQVLATERNLNPADQTKINQLFEQLVDDKYAVRENATNELIAIGEPAVRPLLELCTSPDPEMSYRVINILERIGLEGSPQTLKHVIAGLVIVGKKSDESLIQRSRKLAVRYQSYKSDVAVARLKRMDAQVTEFDTSHGLVRFGGGMGRVVIAGEPIVIDFEDPEVEMDELFSDDLEADIIRILEDAKEGKSDEPSPEEIDDGVPVHRLEDVEEGELGEPLLGIEEDFVFELKQTPASSTVRNIVINSDWTGGPEGLKLLAEVQNLQSVQFNSVELTRQDFISLRALKNCRSISFMHCLFPASDLIKFAEGRAVSDISAVGTAMMGVYPTQYASPEKAGCELQRVAENSGAEKAGMKAGDVIVKVDGLNVVDFPTLTYTVAGRKPNTTLDVVVLRDGKPVEMELTLSPRAEIE